MCSNWLISLFYEAQHSWNVPYGPPSFLCIIIMPLSYAARSILSFNGYCETEGGCPEKALNALSEDQNMAHSYNVLHRNNYDISVALRELIRNPRPKKTTRPWTDDERKRFMQGMENCTATGFALFSICYYVMYVLSIFTQVLTCAYVRTWGGSGMILMRFSCLSS